MQHSKKSKLLLPLVMLASACGGEPVDIGDDRAVRTGETINDYAAEWVGYAEAHTFWSGSDVIRITLDEDGEGKLEVGVAAPVPPATNPDVGYPEGERDDRTVGPNFPAVTLRSGFSYTVLGAVVEDRRLRLGIDLHEFYDGWCEIQTPYPSDAPGTYNCIPGTSGGYDEGQCYQDDPETGDRIYLDCGKIGMCLSNVCSCTAERCDATSESSVRLDAALESDGDELEGTLTVGDNVTVRMMRQ